MTSICVYCGSNAGSDPQFAISAKILGRAIAGAGARLVYGGGDLGLMGVVADACLKSSGEALGVVPRFLLTPQDALAERERAQDPLLGDMAPQSRLSLKIVEDMHSRKRVMYDEADAFVALPGGIGTLEELVEQLSWAQLGRHDKPIVIADIDGFWRPLLDLIDHMRAQGFIHDAYPLRFVTVEKIEDVVPTIFAYLAQQGVTHAVLDPRF